MSGERVDVLAVIRAEVKYLTECAIVRGLAPFENKRLNNLTESLAAVAELIEAAKQILPEYHLMPGRLGPAGALAKLRAALSRIQPDGQGE